MAKEIRWSGILTKELELEVVDTGVSGRCCSSSSLDRFNRRLWIHRVPSDDEGVTSPDSCMRAASSGARIAVVLSSKADMLVDFIDRDVVLAGRFRTW